MKEKDLTVFCGKDAWQKKPIVYNGYKYYASNNLIVREKTNEKNNFDLEVAAKLESFFMIPKQGVLRTIKRYDFDVFKEYKDTPEYEIKTRKCNYCNGSRKVTWSSSVFGRVYTKMDKCPGCDGTGEIEESRQLKGFIFDEKIPLKIADGVFLNVNNLDKLFGYVNELSLNIQDGKSLYFMTPHIEGIIGIIKGEFKEYYQL